MRNGKATIPIWPQVASSFRLWPEEVTHGRMWPFLVVIRYDFKLAAEDFRIFLPHSSRTILG